MPKIDLKVIKGTENLVLPRIPKRYSPTIDIHPTVSIITFMAEKPASGFSDILTALSVTDQTTSINLYKRDWRIATVAAGINPSLACLMCELAQVNSKDVVLDPFAGAGVIPISALKYYGAKQAIAADISGFAISAARKNAQAADVTGKLDIIHSAVANLKLKPKSVTKIISNLPFGIRTGHHAANPAIYSDLLHKSIKLLKPRGLLVMLSQELKLIKQVFSSPSFKILEDLHLFHSGLQPHIFVYQKTT